MAKVVDREAEPWAPADHVCAPNASVASPTNGGSHASTNAARTAVRPLFARVPPITNRSHSAAAMRPERERRVETCLEEIEQDRWVADS